MNEATENTEIKAPRRKTLKGRVVSDKMEKTIVVAVDRRKKHPLYSKIIKVTKKYMAHDYKGDAGIGDLVMIEETRPLSKRKSWRLVEILEKAE
jgi:small subunit ribosomal protein S17